MSESKQDELLSHNYDGIQEYNNSLPRWWVWQFWLTIILSAIYVAYYHFGPGLSQEQILAGELKQQQPAPEKSADVSEEALALLVLQPEVVQSGKALYDTKCMACHGDHAQGIVGPNLTDDSWIHGGKLVDIRRTILEGVAAKGMVPWKGLLTENEVQSIVAYIRSLRGTSPAGAKAPEGENYTPPATI